MTEKTDALSLADALALGGVLNAAVNTSRVARAFADGDVVWGTARRVSGDVYDVLNASLGVTTDSGWEQTWPILELIEEYQSGEFVVRPDE